MFKHSITTVVLRRSLVRLCCCIAFGMLALTSTFAQDEQTPDSKTGRSVVRGRVLFADSEQPVRRATLRLRKELNRDFLKRTISGRRGEFHFDDVPAGTYYIEVNASGVLSSNNGRSFSDFGFSVEDTNPTLVTVDGANEVKIDVKAIRGGTITGRISYADGEPATRALVVLYQQKGENPVLFFPEHPIFTDDRGIYRIEGLPAGQYIVGGTENNSGGANTLPRESAGLVTAYHPAASTASSATSINVQLGGETRDVNIKFGEEPRQISGTVKWKQTNAPVKNATVFLRRVGEPRMNLDYQQFQKMVTPSFVDKDDLLFRDIAFVTLLSTNAPYIEADPEGNWTFFDITPGTYIVSVEAPLPVDEKPKPKQEIPEEPILDFPDLPDFSSGTLSGSAEVTIKDKNVDKVLIELTAGGSVAGSIVIDGDFVSPVSVTAKANSNSPISILDFPVFVEKDRTFVVHSVKAGTVWLDISERAEPNYYIRSITARGVDLIKEPLTIADGERVTGVQIVLGTDLGKIEGRAVAGTGSVAGASVVIFPVDERRRNLRSLWGLARTDADGKFSLRLAPGEYFVLAWSPANEPNVAVESYVRTRASTARRLTIRPNEIKSLEVQTTP
ncbi:MAG TPA: carboxypeptidase-like regulatory domain-containing protein [Pyrinomonadaceae bacterium]|nr:carboxypeptidase-like regulatory domain-containing protein [Pyrinomonadaceae bacterium]